MLDLRTDPIALTAALVDIPSESRHEAVIADEVERALREQTSGFEIVRNGDAVLARTNYGLPSRVLLAGHLDTVPIAGNVPSRRDGDHLYGCGTSDMKSGDAVFLHLAATVAEPAHDITLVMYDCEGDRGGGQRPGPHRAGTAGLAARRRGRPRRTVRRLHRGRLPGHNAGDALGRRDSGAFGAILVGDNAIHKLGAVLDRLAGYDARIVDIDGCTYREGLSAVRIDGGWPATSSRTRPR